jgi:hypothetical protein
MKMKTIGKILLTALTAYTVSPKQAQADNLTVTNVATATAHSDADGAQKTRYMGSFSLGNAGSLDLGLERNYERSGNPDRFQAIYGLPSFGRVKPTIMLFGKFDDASTYFQSHLNTSKNTFNPTLYADIDLGKRFTLSLMDFETYQKGAKPTEYFGEVLAGSLGKVNVQAAAFQSGNIINTNGTKVTHSGRLGVDTKFGDKTVYTGFGVDSDNRLLNVTMYEGGNVGAFADVRYNPITDELKVNIQGATGDINKGVFNTESARYVLNDNTQQGCDFFARRYSNLPVKTKDGVVAQLKFTTSPSGHTGYTAVGYSTPHIGAALGPEFVATKDNAKTGLVGFVQANAKLPLHLLVTESKDPVGSVELSYNSNTKTWDVFTKITYDFGGK